LSSGNRFSSSASSHQTAFDYGVTKIVLLRVDEQAKKAASSKTFVATEEGDLLWFDWKNERTESRGVDACFKIHSSLITELQRNPFAEELVLSVGGKSLCVWKEGVSSPILSHELSAHSYTVATWSQTRPSVMFLGKSDGTVEIWDLLEKTNERVALHNVSVSPISSLSFGLTNAPICQIAFGDDLGMTFVFQVPKILVRPQKNELETLRSYVEMAVKRVKQYKQPVVETKEVARERLKLPDNLWNKLKRLHL
jgi:WD40 repeat protein